MRSVTGVMGPAWAILFATRPAVIATHELPNAAQLKLFDRHDFGRSASAWARINQASKIENNNDVETPPKSRPSIKTP